MEAEVMEDDDSELAMEAVESEEYRPKRRGRRDDVRVGGEILSPDMEGREAFATSTGQGPERGGRGRMSRTEVRFSCALTVRRGFSRRLGACPLNLLALGLIFSGWMTGRAGHCDFCSSACRRATRSRATRAASLSSHWYSYCRRTASAAVRPTKVSTRGCSDEQRGR